FFLLGRERSRRPDLHAHDQVAAPRGLQLRQPASTQSQQAARLCARCDLESCIAVADRGHLEIRAKRCLRERDRQFVDQVGTVAQQARVLLDLEDSEDVTARAATWCGVALRTQRHIVAGGHTGRNAHLDRLFRLLYPVAVARLAWRRDDLPFAVALRTRLHRHHLAEERTLHATHLACTATRLAAHWLRPRRRAGARAGAADVVEAHLQRFLRTGRDFLERERDVRAHVRPASRTCAAARTGARHAAEDVTQPAEVAHEDLERVAEIEAEAAGRMCTALYACMAEAVVGGALLRIAQDLVSFRRFLEVFGSFRRPGIAIRVVLHRELAVRALDGIAIRVPRYAQYFVVITHSDHDGGLASSFINALLYCTIAAIFS